MPVLLARASDSQIIVRLSIHLGSGNLGEDIRFFGRGQMPCLAPPESSKLVNPSGEPVPAGRTEIEHPSILDAQFAQRVLLA